MSCGMPHERDLQVTSSDFDDVMLNTNWEDVRCPICLDFPHNGVLLRCSSYKEGCQPFICDTDSTHSNCLDRFKRAHGMEVAVKTQTTDPNSRENVWSTTSDSYDPPTCPLCRGEVTGWVIIDTARVHLDSKKRCCEEESCIYIGNFSELQNHAKIQHPNSRPSDIDPARQLDWENFQQSTEIIDVLNTIHSEVPRGVVLGDYVIEYGGEDSGDEHEDYPGDRGNCWTSCILYQMFDPIFNCRSARRRRRARTSEATRERHSLSDDSSSLDDCPNDIAELGIDEVGDSVRIGDAARHTSNRRSSRRRRSRFYDR